MLATRRQSCLSVRGPAAVPGPKRSPAVLVPVSSRMPPKVQTRAVPPMLSLPETVDACKYAELARLAYEADKDKVLAELKGFETTPGVRPFKGLVAGDVEIINYKTKLFDISFIPGALQTDTEVLFIRVPGKGFDNDPLEAPGDQLIVAFRGTETNLKDGFRADLLTDLRAVRASIREIKGLGEALEGSEYDKMMVHRGFLTAFNDLMTGGDDKRPTMEAEARKLLRGKPPARVVCCGHSLGAALATLGAFWWSKVHPEVEVFCYAFASPRVGNQAFCNDFLAGTGSSKQLVTVAQNRVDKAYRFTHKGDLVPAVPPPLLGYSHVEQAVFLLEPNDRGWGVVEKGELDLAPGQAYAALLAQRPSNYLAHRLTQPFSSTSANYHSMDQHLAALQDIISYNNSSSTGSGTTGGRALQSTAATADEQMTTAAAKSG